jgi:hypothetical protein
MTSLKLIAVTNIVSLHLSVTTTMKVVAVLTDMIQLLLSLMTLKPCFKRWTEQLNQAVSQSVFKTLMT